MDDHQQTANQAIAAHPRAAELGRLVHTVLITAADERRRRLGDGIDELARDLELAEGDAEVGGTDVIALLRGETSAEATGRAMVVALMARAVTDSPPSDDAAADRLAERVSWLAASTWFDGLAAIGDGLSGEARARWVAALSGLVRGADANGLSEGRGSALAAATALASSGSATELLRDAISDPLLRAALGGVARSDGGSDASLAQEDSSGAASFEAELIPAPLGPVGLVLQTFSGILLLRYIGRLVGKLLVMKRPTEVQVAASSVTLRTKLHVLGKTLREREVVIPRANLARASREVRYRGLPLYAGVIALCIGTYVGVSFVTDGVRAGSPSLLGVGALIVTLGVVLDLVFANLVPAGRGQHRLVIVPRRGRTMALSTPDARSADRALRLLRTG
jgi:hypothetical protein